MTDSILGSCRRARPKIASPRISESSSLPLGQRSADLLRVDVRQRAEPERRPVADLLVAVLRELHQQRDGEVGVVATEGISDGVPHLGARIGGQLSNRRRVPRLARLEVSDRVERTRAYARVRILQPRVAGRQRSRREGPSVRAARTAELREDIEAELAKARLAVGRPSLAGDEDRLVASKMQRSNVMPPLLRFGIAIDREFGGTR